MTEHQPDSWKASKGLARAILHDRKERRKWLGRMILVPVLMLILGLWVLGDWIWENPWRALAWWGGCMWATMIVVIFVIYDALLVVREERKKLTK